MNIRRTLSKTLSLLLLVVLVCVPSSSCSKSVKKDAGTAAKPTDSATKNTDSINIKYVGNSCFYITFADGTRLVTDPYGILAGFPNLPSLTADVITISHTHSDHTAGIGDVKGNPKVVNPEDLDKLIKVGDVEITGFDSAHVANMGNNTVFVYKEGNLKIVNMGETDKIDSPKTLEAIKDADVVLAYAGEYGEVKNPEIFKFLDSINAKAIIPEHYSMDPNNLFYGQPTLDTIIKEVPAGTKIVKQAEFNVTPGLEKQFVALSSMSK